MTDLTYLGKTNWHNQDQLFGIRDRDRLHHLYVLGKTGVGKSTLLLNMAISDIRRGNGLAVIDPHGDLAIALLQYIPDGRTRDVIYFNPADTNTVIPFNPLAGVPAEQHHLAVAGLIATFKRIWAESWGPRMEHILRYALFTLLEYGQATLLDLPLLITDAAFQRIVLAGVKSEAVRTFWKGEMDRLSPFLKAEAVSPILNKLGLFKINQALRLTVGSRTQTWQVRDVMDRKQIFIANLSKGTLGEDASSLLGSMLLHAFQLAALSRATRPEGKRLPFYFYVDEAHSFLSLALADTLAEARKYGLSLFLTNQYLDQLHEKIQSAIFGNVGTLIAFRLGASDARLIAQEFHPVITGDDLVNLPRHHIYLKLMIDGATSKPFSAVTLPLPPPGCQHQDFVVEHSKKSYGSSHTEDHPLKDRLLPDPTGPGQARLF